MTITTRCSTSQHETWQNMACCISTMVSLAGSRSSRLIGCMIRFKPIQQNVSSGAPQSGKIGRYFRDIGYGYQWWSARVGDHHFNYAAGHGGQLIVLLDELDMIIVTTADPFFQQHDGQSWKHEKAIINLVGRVHQLLAERVTGMPE